MVSGNRPDVVQLIGSFEAPTRISRHMSSMSYRGMKREMHDPEDTTCTSPLVKWRIVSLHLWYEHRGHRTKMAGRSI